MSITSNHFNQCAEIYFDSKISQNAIDYTNLFEFPKLISYYSKLKNIKYIIIRGHGKFFCTGGSLEFLHSLNQSDEATCVAALRAGQKWIEEMLKSDCLIVCHLNGLATGAGVDVCMSGDVTLVGERSRINMFYNRLGAIPDLGGLWLLSNKVGRSRAIELYAEKRTLRGSDDLFRELGSDLPNEDAPGSVSEWDSYLGNRYPISKIAFGAAKRSITRPLLSNLVEHQKFVAKQQTKLIRSEFFGAEIRKLIRFRSARRGADT